MTEREKQLREVAQAEVDSLLDSYDWGSLHEALEYDYDELEVTEQESYFIYDLVSSSVATLSESHTLEEYTA